MNYDDASKTLTLDYVGTEPLVQKTAGVAAAAPADCETQVKTLGLPPNAGATLQESTIPVVSRRRPFLGAGKGFGPEVVIDRSNVEHVRLVTVFGSSQFVADQSETGPRLREHLRSWGHKLDVTIDAKIR